MGNASSFAVGMRETKRWRRGPFSRDHLAKLSSLKVKIGRIVRRARSDQAWSNRSLQQSVERVGKFSAATRRDLAAQGVDLYRDALQAVELPHDNSTFPAIPEGRHVRLSEYQFEDLIVALQSKDPEPIMRRLGINPLDKVYKGTLRPESGRHRSDFAMDWNDVQPVIEWARMWKWPSLPALQKWVYVVE